MKLTKRLLLKVFTMSLNKICIMITFSEDLEAHLLLIGHFSWIPILNHVQYSSGKVMIYDGLFPMMIYLLLNDSSLEYWQAVVFNLLIHFCQLKVVRL